jgi:hypothetical protein
MFIDFIYDGNEGYEGFILCRHISRVVKGFEKGELSLHMCLIDGKALSEYFGNDIDARDKRFNDIKDWIMKSGS